LPIPLDDLLTNCEPGPALEIEHGGGGAETHILSGAYRFDPDESHPVFGYLPTVIHRSARLGEPSTGAQAALQLLSHELEEQRPGYQAVVDRLVDMVFIFLVRSWIESQPEEVKGWLAALRHPQIRDAICLLHRRPHEGWTVGSLARSVGMSRSAFARDFKALTGESPLAYVTHWRMETAARLLRSTSEPLASIADRVGYESEYSFGKAFRRIKGVAPGRYRAAVSRRSRPEANRRTARGDGSDDERPRRTAAHPSRRA
jgi:AraC-like DNA-binding protein